MAKIILNDGTEECLTPGAAAAKVAAGQARFADGVPMYSTTYKTRELVAEAPKKRRKRKPKPKLEPEPETVEPIEDEITPQAEPDQVDADEAE